MSEAVYQNRTIYMFTTALASKQPTPGGGGASALAGALGIALGSMVGELTVGKAKYADVEERINELLVEAEKIRTTLLAFIDDDAMAFAKLAEAYKIPKDNPRREAILEEATIGACIPPRCIMDECARAVCIIEEMAEKGSKLAVSDAGCAAALCRAAMEAAALNIYINTKTFKDKPWAQMFTARAKEMVDEYSARAQKVYEKVERELMQGI